jgi:hypothetical protein
LGTWPIRAEQRHRAAAPLRDSRRGLALTGPGAISLDSLFGFTGFSSPLIAWAALIAAVVSGFGNLALRRLPTAITA